MALTEVTGAWKLVDKDKNITLLRDREAVAMEAAISELREAIESGGAHNHDISDVNGLQDALDDKMNADITELALTDLTVSNIQNDSGIDVKSSIYFGDTAGFSDDVTFDTGEIINGDAGARITLPSKTGKIPTASLDGTVLTINL